VLFHWRGWKDGQPSSNRSSLDIANRSLSHVLWAFLSGIFVRLQSSHKSADGWPVGAGFTAGCTLWLADSTGDMGHKGERVETLLGTRSEPASLAAIHRGHKSLPTCCCTRLHNRQRPKLVRRELQRIPHRKQSGSSRLLFGLMQGKIRAAHIVPRLLAWANTRAQLFPLMATTAGKEP
jgi:hypothetical protein